MKVTDPVGTAPDIAPVTVAVSVTDLPAIDGVPLEARSVTVFAGATASTNGVDALDT
jgi:hypothetical protein